MQEHRRSAFLSARRCSEYAHARGVHVRIAPCGGLYPQPTVGKTCILQVLVTHILKLLSAPRRPHTVHLHNDEPQFGQRRHVPVVRNEVFRSVGASRSGIDIFDDGVRPRRVKVGRSPDDTPNIGLAVTSFGCKHFGSLPSFGRDGCDIGRLKCADKAAVGGTKFCHRRAVDHRIGVYHISEIGRELRPVIAFGRCQTSHAATVGAYAVVTYKIRVLTFIDSRRCEIYLSGLFVHAHHLTHTPLATRYLPYDTALGNIIEIKMIPVVTLAHPYHLAAVAIVMPEITVIVYKRFRPLLHDRTYPARSGIHSQYAQQFVAAPVVQHRHLTAIRLPAKIIQFILIVTNSHIGFHLAACMCVNYYRCTLRQTVARLGVLLLMKYGL